MAVQLYNKALRRLLEFCGIDRPRLPVRPGGRGQCVSALIRVASSKLARKTHVDMLNKVQINYYAAGLHREGSKAAFGEEEYRV